MIDPHLLQEAQRRRLVRLCASVTGDRDAAEDLAQETLLEAWRNGHKLHDPEGADRWLAAIARNVCLRWARRRGRDGVLLARVDAGTPHRVELDVEIELERAELAELLDRALALLPPVTRDVLVHRYVHESPHAEIAARLGLSEDAVSMRVSRGKVVLRQVLASELAERASAYGLVDTRDDGWRQTRVWCGDCGRQRLLVRRDERRNAISFRCPRCNPDAPGAVFRLDNPVLGDLLGELVRPAAILARAAEWSWRYFAGGVRRVPCTRCGRPAPVRRYDRDRDGRRTDGLYVRCACGEEVSSSVNGLALSLPAVRRFRREHPRTRRVPKREVDRGGVAAIVVGYEDVAGSAGVDVLVERDTLRVLEVHGPRA